MPKIEDIQNEISAIESKIGYTFKDKNLLVLAFIHRSFTNENRELSEHNERLEFLGDSVLGLLISDFLYRNLPDTPEGELSYLRSRLVEASACVLYVNKLNIESYLLLGKGERLNDGRGRDSILADLFEAIIGAIFLDGGIEPVKKFLFHNFSEEFKEIIKTPVRNFKAQLQDWCQKIYHTPPVYKVMSESGPDHSKTFTISVIVDHKEVGHGEGPSKKEAQQAAAEDAILKLEIS